MLKFFQPHEFYDSIKDIDYDALWKKGIKGLLFDIDNTVASYSEIVPSISTMKLFETLKSMGFKIAFVSNNNKKRVYTFNKGLKFPAVYYALKPMTLGVGRAIRILGTKVSETAIIGDQIFTDICCGKIQGIYTILVKPIKDKNSLTVKAKRFIEKKIMEKYDESK